MKKSVIWLPLVFLGTVICIAGCRTNLTATSSSVSEQADDVLMTPAGLAYRANITQQGVPNKWPPIQTVDVTLTSGSDSFQLNYRATIETKAGQTRNNIFRLYGTDILTMQGVTAVFEPVNLPSGFEANEAQTAISPTTTAAMSLQISPQVKPGSYTIQVSVQIGSKDFGQVTSTVTVTE